MIRSLLIAVICFVCGVLVGKIAPQHAATAIATDQRAQESKSGSSNVQAPCTAQAQTSHSTAASQGAADITVSNQFTKSAKIVVAQPKSVPVQVLDADTEAKALELISAPLPSVRGTFQKQGPDGSVDVFGKSDDGRSFYRHLWR